ncbi:MAG: RecX family transcriptional regulator [Sphingobacteriaceae bacterium]|nr:RecX family transcriptional regulator [Cytophagaceae bacterium]
MNSPALKKAAAFCAYQERTQQEVRQRLREWGVWGDEAEEIIVRLIEDGFLNEERFARAFAGGKFRVKSWGRVKIEQELRQRGLSGHTLKAGLSEISADDYRQTLQELLDKKAVALSDEEPFARRQKLARYAISKGYEPDLVWSLLKGGE